MTTATPAIRRRPAIGEESLTPARTLPVNVWAGVGALALVFIAFVLVRWVTGPFFKPVPSGPSDPPTLMKVNMIFWEVISIPCALALIYRLAIMPWIRERQI